MSGSAVVRELTGDATSMHALVAAARTDTLTDADLADLAIRLAGSGATLPVDPSAADVASTGGIGSLSTLICPLQLRTSGFRVPKLGVAGRPAGGVDVLQTIPGFDADLSPHAAESALASHGYVHLRADKRWVPLDATLFAYRQRTGAQTVPSLVIASLLAKKVAVGVVGAGLDVRVAPHGNFGSSFETARNNAHRYQRVARMLGLAPSCVLTDASQPCQPYLGRGEALLGLWVVVTGAASDWLQDHVGLCEKLVERVLAAVPGRPAAPAAADLADAHRSMLDAHGTTWDAWERRVDEIRAAHRRAVTAPAAGVITYDLERLRGILVDRQRDEPTTTGGAPPDPAGVVLEARPGERVARGAPVLSVRVPPGEARLVDLVASCVHVGRNDDLDGPRQYKIEVA